MTTRMKAYLLLVALIAGCVGLLLPAPVGAQGGNAVYNSLRVKIPIARQYLEPQGLQDAAYDLLYSGMSTMSLTYVTVMSGSVTVGEAGDAVLIHVTGLFSDGSSVTPHTVGCMIRLARGTTEIDVVELGNGQTILFDTTFVDAPPVGTHIYTLQVRRETGGSCSVNVAGSTGGSLPPPLPSLLVQSYYAGSIP